MPVDDPTSMHIWAIVIGLGVTNKNNRKENNRKVKQDKIQASWNAKLF